MVCLLRTLAHVCLLILLIGRPVNAGILNPIVRHSMVARCSAHLLQGPVERSNVTALIEGLSNDERFDVTQRRRLSVILSELRSSDSIAVTQIWRGSDEISAFAAGMDQVTAEMDEVIRDHLRPPRVRVESAVYAASLIQIGVETAGMWVAHFHGDKALNLYHNAMTTIGFVSFFAFDFVMGQVSDYRLRHGWQSPADGATDRDRKTFEASLNTRLAQVQSTSGTQLAPMSLSRRETVPLEYARALRDAKVPSAMPADAVDRLVGARDRYIPIIREVLFGKPHGLSLDYVFFNDVEGRPVLITVAILKQFAIWPGGGGRRRKRLPAKQAPAKWLGLAPAN